MENNNFNLQEKKRWLDFLYYKENKQKDFFVCGTYIDRNGEKKFSKWKTYLNCVANIDVGDFENNDWKDLAFFKKINQRQILPHEIVLDIEDPEEFKPIVERLKKWEWGEYHIFETGSRGYHIHMFCDRNMNTEEKEAVVKKLGTDIQKCSEKNLIALENYPHWKTGKLKCEINL